MYIQRQGTAVWEGPGAQGSGTLTTGSRVLSSQLYSANARFSEEVGSITSPEELIAAAHAGCFTMALAFALEKAGHPPQELRATATVRLEKMGDGWEIRSSNLELDANVPGIDEGELSRLAVEAKASCPVSKVLRADVGLTIHGPPAPGATARGESRRPQPRGEA